MFGYDGFSRATAPIIKSFSPTSARVGEQVIITGENFDDKFNTMLVFVGGVPATIKDGSTTELSVTVPLEAKMGPIIVISVSGLLATSNVNFIPTYANGVSTIDTNAFGAENKITTEDNPERLESADFDKDGLIDLLLTHSGGAISIYQNTTKSIPSFDVSKFAVNVPSGFGPKIHDLDGDGLLDIVFWGSSAVAGTYLAYMVNKSTPGKITFEAGSTFPIEGTPSIGLVLSDLDQDGRVDVAAMTSSTISIYLNTSSIGKISFSGPTTLPTGGGDLTAGDLNDDGLPELIHAAGANLEVITNTSTQGKLTFDRTDTFKPNSSVAIVKAADMDQDGFLDIIVGSQTQTAIEIFRNAYASDGKITLDEPIGFNTGEGSSSYGDFFDVGDINGDKLPDIAVPSVTEDRVFVYGNKSEPGTIAMNEVVVFATSTAPFADQLDDIDGDERPDLIYTNRQAEGKGTLSIRLNQTEATSITTSLSPSSAEPGQSITVNYVVTGIFNSGNKFTAQLSDKNGSFASPTAVASITSQSSGSMGFTLSAAAPAGNYKVRVVSDNPIVTSNAADLLVSYAEPSTQASNIVFSNVAASQMTLTWTNGNGTSRLVIVKQGSAVNSNPVDLTSYTANAVFGSGSQIGTGNYVVYKGTGNTVTISSLTAGNTYHVRVYEYRGTAGSENYKVTTATGNPASKLFSPFVVTNTNDSGEGSLRWAITNANGSSGKTISFNIASASPWTITPATALPIITATTIMDATTQPGWSSTNLVKIQGSASISNGLSINANNCEVYGLHLTGFTASSGAGILINAGISGGQIGAPSKGNLLNGNQYGVWSRASNITFYGNKFGTNTTGSSAVANTDCGLYISAGGNNRIGGAGIGERNLISGNGNYGIRIINANNNIIKGNIIGLDATGLTALANGIRGLELGFNVSNSSNGNIVGGSVAGEGNIISGNSSVNVIIFNGSSNIIKGNSIGVDINGDIVSAGTIHGIELIPFSTNPVVDNNVIGGFGAGEGNIIAGHSQYGVYLDPKGYAANGTTNSNTIRGNKIYCNGKGGIGLKDNANGSILPPSITNYTTGAGTSVISGSCASCSTGDLIDVYRDKSGCLPGQGNEYLGTVSFTSGSWSLGSLTLSAGDIVTAQVTNASGNTSEFATTAPEINVLNGATPLTDNVSSIDVGQTLQGNSLDVIFTVQNSGLSALNLTLPLTVSGTGFTVHTQPASSVVNPFASTTFVLRLSGATAGTFSNRTVTIQSNDADEATFTFQVTGTVVAPEINVYNGSDDTSPAISDGQATAVSVGSTTLGADIIKTFAIKNSGTSTLTISSISVSGTDYSINSSISTINAGSIETFTITLSAAVSGSFDALVTIVSDDADEDPFTFSVTGGVAEPEIDVYVGSDNSGILITDEQVSAVDVGSAVQGNNITQTFAIENSGTSVLNVSSITVSGAAFSVASSITTIAGGGTQTFSITLSGVNTGNFNATVTIISDDANENPFTFPVTGTITFPEINVFDGATDVSPSITDSQVTAINFGSAVQGSEIIRTFAIKNSGTSILNVSGITVSGTDYSVNSSISTIAANATETFTVSLAGTNTGNFGATVTITSDDADESDFTFPVTGTITFPEINVFDGATDVSPAITDAQVTAINFGSAVQGSEIIRTFAIKNSGTSVLNVSGVTVSGTDYSVNSTISTVAANATETFTVSLSGANTGNFSAPVTITSDDADENPFTFPITGTITYPEINVFAGNDKTASAISDDQTEPISFEPTVKGIDVSRTFTIENTGTSALNISSVTVSGSDFSVSSAITSVATNASANFSITLSGANAGTFNATVTIASDDADENPFTFPITGTVTYPEINVFAGTDNSATMITDGQTSAVEFGSAVQGNPITRTFAIQNAGTSVLTVSGINLSGTDFSVSNTVTSVAAGATETFTVTLSGDNTGNFSADVTIGSDNSGDNSFTFPITGSITYPNIEVFAGEDNSAEAISDEQATPVSFGSAVQGNNIARTFAIENTGTSTLTISEVTVSGTGYSVTNAITAIAAGATETFTVMLSGTDTGTFDGVVTITSDDADESPFTFPVSGTITFPEINVFAGTGNTAPAILNGQSTPVDFGSGAEGSEISQAFAIENTGTSNLNISAITVDGTDFSVSSTIASISPGNTEIFTVTLSGTNAGLFNASVTIISDDLDESSFTFPITGEILSGVPLVPEIEIFVGSSDTGTSITDGQSTAIEMGITEQGVDLSAVFTIKNTGNSALEITGITSSSEVFSISSSVTSILPGTTGQFTVVMDASAGGNFTTTISITSNDEDEAAFEFSINGKVEFEEMQVIEESNNKLITSNTTVNLGTTQFGDPISKVFFITNPSESETLIIHSVEITGDEFEVAQVPETVEIGETGLLEVVLRATAEGRFSGTVTIKSNFADFVFDVSGEVGPRNKTIHVFNVLTPNGDGKHDFLKIERITEYANNSVSIFTKAGKLVYQADRYDNIDIKFEGNGNVGSNQALDAGTYYYLIKLERGKNESGFIQLLRD
ncbi:choice-of-anchor D domain-containing protein [Imperialibacter roseus]|uniref:Choice-of-anchor D domain-containing protein n=1 Tax=Imperialibacter roseus TaxID=1324217 RepID=A0ABZ0IZK1_9BACT|nr:choice-of-anchor D domain-containing protein [Imperialibacter roseus]WOK09370.1 choice-of-anchor D domain-containing protein [Imperialibacter roseus]